MYMMMGMTYEEYWHSDHDVYRFYRKAWKARREEENKRDWLLGAYFYNAVGTAIGNAFRKKGAHVQNYVEEPWPIFPLSKEEAEAKEQKELERMDEQLHAWAERMKAQQEKIDASIRPTDYRDNSGCKQGDEGDFESCELAD